MRTKIEIIHGLLVNKHITKNEALLLLESYNATPDETDNLPDAPVVHTRKVAEKEEKKK